MQGQVARLLLRSDKSPGKLCSQEKVWEVQRRNGAMTRMWKRWEAMRRIHHAHLESKKRNRDPQVYYLCWISTTLYSCCKMSNESSCCRK